MIETRAKTRIVEPIISHQYLELLQHEQPDLIWDESSQESYFVYQDQSNQQHKVYYPSIRFLALRLEMATEFDLAGLAIWELGQGLCT